MAKRKPATPTDEKLEKIDIDLFEVLAALDRKDYNYYDRLTIEQQKKIVPFMLLHWMSAIKGSAELSRYYLLSTAAYANKYMFNEHVMRHPKLQWLMLCAASPDLGKQFHQWIPHIKDKTSKLREPAKPKDVKEYFKKIYPKTTDHDLSLLTEVYIDNHKRKLFLAEKFPNMKFEDIEILSEIITEEDIKQYEQALGN
jgi:hypothetical protein